MIADLCGTVQLNPASVRRASSTKAPELPGPDVPLDVGGAETVMFEGGVLHPGGTAVSDGISDDSVVSH